MLEGDIASSAMQSHIVDARCVPAETDQVNFNQTPLDHTTDSVRLLKIIADLSASGLIQCEIRHDTTRATYTCLSYVWGTEHDQQSILVNGKEFSIRKNLWDFLTVARTKYASTCCSIWIDAICIDQGSIAERNHQVAQMGKIYSQAVEVIAWLGFSESIGYFLDFSIRLAIEQPRDEKHARKLWYRMQSEEIQGGWLSFWANPYWKRAWITQEIFSAKSFLILVTHVEIGRSELRAIELLFPLLSSNAFKFWQENDPEHWLDTARMFGTYMRAMAGRDTLYLKRSSSYLGGKMIDLLYFLPERSSQIPRDQIYSLFSVATDGAAIPVNYGSSNDDFFIHLIHGLTQSMCFCSVAYIASILRYRPACSSAQNKIPMSKFMLEASTLERDPGPHLKRLPFILRHKDTYVDSLTDVASPTPLQARTRCGHCGKNVTLCGDDQYAACLGITCRRLLGHHLVIRKDAATDRRPSVARLTSPNGNSHEVDVTRTALVVSTSTFDRIKCTESYLLKVDLRLDSLISIAQQCGLGICHGVRRGRRCFNFFTVAIEEVSHTIT